MEGGGNGRSCAMYQLTLKSLRTCTKFEGGRSMLALDVLRFLGFQMGLNEVQFEALGDYVHYFYSYCGSIIQIPKEICQGSKPIPKTNIKLHCYLQRCDPC